MQMTKIEWLTKEEAAVRLGDPGIPMSTRRVLELAAEGKLRSTRAQDPDSGQRVVYIDAGSVERYLDQRHALEKLTAFVGGAGFAAGLYVASQINSAINSTSGPAQSERDDDDGPG